MPWYSPLTKGQLTDGDFAWLSDAYKAGRQSKSEGRKFPYKKRGARSVEGWNAAMRRLFGTAASDFRGGPTKQEVFNKLMRNKPKGTMNIDPKNPLMRRYRRRREAAKAMTTGQPLTEEQLRLLGIEMRDLFPIEVSLTGPVGTPQGPATGRRFLAVKERGGDTYMPEDQVRETLAKIGVDLDVMKGLRPEDVDKVLDDLDVTQIAMKTEGTDGAGLVAAIRKVVAKFGAGQAPDDDEPELETDDTIAGEAIKTALAPVQAELEAEKKARRELEERVRKEEEARAHAARIETAKSVVADLVSERHITPATGEKLEPVFVALGDQKFARKTADGEDEEVSLADELAGALREAYKIQTMHFSQISVPDVDEEKKQAELVAAMHDRVAPSSSDNGK